MEGHDPRFKEAPKQGKIPRLKFDGQMFRDGHDTNSITIAF